MMEDISNRTLAIIMIAAILISFGGTLFGMARLTMMTGVRAPKVFVPLINAMATLTATVNLSVLELSEVNWTPGGLNWSQGRIDDGTLGCTIDSAGQTGSGNNCTIDPFEGQDGTAVSNGLNLTNTGNTNVTIKLKSDKTAATFIGGTGASAKWNVSDAWGQTGEDANGLQSICEYSRNFSITTKNLGNYTAFATSDTDVCDGNSSLMTTPKNNTLRVDFEFVIPYDSPAGSKSAVITATYAKVT